MVALTEEGSSTIEGFQEKTEMPYPVAAGAKTQGWSIKAWPTAYLLDHNGEVIWAGNTGFGWVDMLPEALKAAEAMADAWDPGDDRGPELKKAVAAARDGDMSKAWKESTNALKKAAEDADATERIEAFRADYLARAAGRTEHMESMIAEARYYEAQLFLEAQMDLFKGAPPADDWKQLIGEWKKEKSIKGLLSLDKKRLAAVAKAKDGDKEKAVKDLRKLVESADGTRLDAVMRETLTRVQTM